MKDYNLIIILGPTASGKTSLAVQLASKIDGEIISADSRQVYRGMDIGTGKDLAEYTVAGSNIPYHLIDIIDAGEKYNLYEYQKDFIHCFHEIQLRNKAPILCGGSGLYIETALGKHPFAGVPVNPAFRENLDGKSHEDLQEIFNRYQLPKGYSPDLSTIKRTIRALEILEFTNNNNYTPIDTPRIRPLIFGLNPTLALRRKRISTRLYQRLEEGMVEEVQSLIDDGIPTSTLKYYGLEYKFITEHLEGKLSFEEMTTQLETAIHRFAKRQMTFFRKMEKSGLNIHWLNDPALEKAIEVIALNA